MQSVNVLMMGGMMYRPPAVRPPPTTRSVALGTRRTSSRYPAEPLSHRSVQKSPCDRDEDQERPADLHPERKRAFEDLAVEDRGHHEVDRLRRPECVTDGGAVTVHDAGVGGGAREAEGDIPPRSDSR